MVFHNDGKPLFEVPLPDVSTATVNKNEVKLTVYMLLLLRQLSDSSTSADDYI